MRELKKMQPQPYRIITFIGGTAAGLSLLRHEPIAIVVARGPSPPENRSTGLSSISFH